MDELLEAALALAAELKDKNFPREKHAAYLTCFLNIGTVDKFLTAVENAEPQPSTITRCKNCGVMLTDGGDICFECSNVSGVE